MRGSENDSNSLDLLLDAICNTFGGIVFLAILLSLMLMGKSARQKSLFESPPIAVSASEVRQLLDQLDTLAAENELLAITASQLPTRAQYQDGGQLQSLADEVQQFHAIHGELLNKNADLTRSLADQIASNADLLAENEEVVAAVESVSAAVTGLQQDLQASIDQASTNVTLPQARRQHLARAIVLFKDGKLWVAHRPTGGESGFDKSQVTVDRTGDSFLITPIAGKGVSAASAEDLPAVNELISNVVTTATAITFAIWPDSFQHFPMIQQVLIERKILYEQWVQAEEEELSISFGNDAGGLLQ